MDDAADHLDRLRAALVGVGSAKDDLKTEDFNVGTEYESRQDRNCSYKRVFVGYVVTHSLRINSISIHGFSQNLSAQSLPVLQNPN